MKRVETDKRHKVPLTQVRLTRLFRKFVSTFFQEQKTHIDSLLPVYLVYLSFPALPSAEIILSQLSCQAEVSHLICHPI